MLGCSTTPANIPTSLNSADQKSILPAGETYHIGPDDVLQISVWRNADLSIDSVPVRPDGMISMPLIGDVTAAGLTPPEVASIIEKALLDYVRNPQVAVIITELTSHEFLSRIRVTGSVQTPVSMTYRQGMTVLDAVLEAGGLTELASANKTHLYRKSETGISVYDIELGKILNKGKLQTNYLLQPGDIITVPDRIF
jgi:polysaccharide export outer membrane protein